MRGGLIDMRKLGAVMWARTFEGLMAPVDLHFQLSHQDLANLDEIYQVMIGFRKIDPILEAITRIRWIKPKLALLYVEASLRHRQGARTMKAHDEWDVFWNRYLA